ncbi:AraC family transcriptional regulator [uncultured Deinococcus sp.]|uniref:AraC family transcriptional regulator n=1 Tax=uncultured Deinococcus sp. TaxID=158789 RepID=UPI002582BE2A|nr:AraC family transcriptional regulator [uncultured Deinococcus sp.]
MDDPRGWLRPGPAGDWLVETLFDAVPDLNFFVKDGRGRYVSVNEALRRRSGAQHKRDLIGRTAAEVFTGEAGERFSGQDERTLRDGAELRDVLELYFGAGGEPVWCLTSKWPLRDASGAVVGLVGVSRDVPAPGDQTGDFARVAEALAYMGRCYDRPLRMPEVAARAGLSEDSLGRLVRRVCHVTPKQFLLRVRLDAATRLLRDPALSVAQVAHACGYSDHSAFTRTFRAVTGLSPQAYRQRMGPSGDGNTGVLT